MKSLADVLHAVVCETKDAPAKALADRIGVRYGYLLDAANPDREEVQFQARWIVPLTLASKNDAIVRYLAEAVGGVFYRVQHDQPADEHTSRALKEFGDYLHAVAVAAADRVYTPAEARIVEEQGLEAVTAILAHIDHVRHLAGIGPRVSGVKESKS